MVDGAATGPVINIGVLLEENGLGKGGDQRRSAEQRELRQRRGERAFLFDKDLSRCLAEVDRDEWERALSSSGGDVVLAARQCGLDGVPPGAKALWGRSAEEARDTYRRWQKRRLRQAL
jgi:hypothetical protein